MYASLVVVLAQSVCPVRGGSAVPRAVALLLAGSAVLLVGLMTAGLAGLLVGALLVAAAAGAALLPSARRTSGGH